MYLESSPEVRIVYHVPGFNSIGSTGIGKRFVVIRRDGFGRTGVATVGSTGNGLGVEMD
jgi:hypothetical protein